MHTTYRLFTDQLVTALTGDPRILGIVALGSMAERGRTPDPYSDHDFFVITEAAEAFRGSTHWLPDSARIAFWFRETPHGCKAVYDDGHLVEYAVFTPDEISLARANDYRVLLDRERIEERMAAIAARTDAPPTREWLEGMFLSHVLVGTQRARRGELASSRWMLAHAMRFLVQLLGGGPDNLDPLRRFRHEGVEAAMLLPPLQCGPALLDVYERELAGDARAVASVRI